MNSIPATTSWWCGGTGWISAGCLARVTHGVNLCIPVLIDSPSPPPAHTGWVTGWLLESFWRTTLVFVPPLLSTSPLPLGFYPDGRVCGLDNRLFDTAIGLFSVATHCQLRFCRPSKRKFSAAAIFCSL